MSYYFMHGVVHRMHYHGEILITFKAGPTSLHSILEVVGELTTHQVGEHLSLLISSYMVNNL